MANLTLTGLNSIFLLGVTGLIDTPQPIGGYSADGGFAADAIDVAETALGVDGNLSAGLIAVAYPMQIDLMANSPSIDLFETWVATELSNKDKLSCYGSLTITSLGREYVLTNGFLTKYPPLPSFKKILEKRTFEIVWNSITPVPV